MKNHFIYILGLAILAVSSIQLTQAQVDTCCAGGGQVRLEFDHLDMLRQIQAYEDTIAAITGTLIEEDYRRLEWASPKLYQRYDGFALDSVIYNLRVALAQARAAADGGACSPCSIFNGILTYNASKYSPRDVCQESNFCFLPTLYTGAFLNGDSIPDTPDDEAWASAEGPARSNHPFVDTSPAGLGLQPFSYYGHHYNLHAIVDERKLCPPGWALVDSATIALAESDEEMRYIMRREPDGNWIEDETWTESGTLPGTPPTPYTTELNERTLAMYGLGFSGASVADSVAFYARNDRGSSFGLPSPNSGYLPVAENHGVTVGCQLLGYLALANDPYYIEWEAVFGELYPGRLSAGEAWVANNILLTGNEAPLWSEFHNFPHVRTEAATMGEGTMVLNADLYYSIHDSEVGFLVGNTADLSTADTLMAMQADSIEVSNGVFQPGGKFSLDTLPSGPLYFAAFAKAGYDGTGDRYMFGDTLEAIIP